MRDIPFRLKGAVHSASLSGADISFYSPETAQTGLLVVRFQKSCRERGVDRSNRTKLVAISVLTMDEDALHSIGDGS